MKHLHVPLENRLNEREKEELFYKLNFLNGLDLREENDKLIVSCGDSENTESLYETVMKIVNEVHLAKKIPLKRIFENRPITNLYHDDVFQELLYRKHITHYCPGLISFDQMLSSLAEYFDEQFKEIGRQFGAETHTYPTLIPMEILERCRYFESFPQYVNFVMHLTENHDVISAFHQSWINRHRDDFNFNAHFSNIKCALSPAVCLHTYKRYQNEEITSDLNKIITAKGKCFRYESNNMKTLERLWDFTMREIVFIGEQEFVNEMRRKSISRLSSFVDKLGLHGYIEIANDPFFTNDAEKKKIYQLGFELKYELRLHLPSEKKEISVGSFNIHQDFFGNTFNIGIRNKGAAFTGCTAFGIERWVYAFLSQYGLEMSLWPKEVNDYVQSKTNIAGTTELTSH